MMAERSLVTIKEAQRLTTVSRRCIYNWMRNNKVEYVRTAGGCVRIFTDTLFTPGNVPPARPPDEHG